MVQHEVLDSSPWNRGVSKVRDPRERLYAAAMLELNSDEGETKIDIANAAVEARLMELPETERREKAHLHSALKCLRELARATTEFFLLGNQKWLRPGCLSTSRPLSHFGAALYSACRERLTAKVEIGACLLFSTSGFGRVVAVASPFRLRAG